MSLLKVPMPKAFDVEDIVLSSFIDNYQDYLEQRYNIENITSQSWFIPLILFMYMAYDERIDYHNIRGNHICNLWENEEDGIKFLTDNIVLHMAKNLNRFDYYFQEKTSFINVSQLSSIENESSVGDSYSVNEIAPIDSAINTITTPNAKNNNKATTSKNRTYTNFDDIKKFIDFNSYTEYENECFKTIDNLVFEHNVIY